MKHAWLAAVAVVSMVGRAGADPKPASKCPAVTKKSVGLLTARLPEGTGEARDSDRSVHVHAKGVDLSFYVVEDDQLKERTSMDATKRGKADAFRARGFTVTWKFADALADGFRLGYEAAENTGKGSLYSVSYVRTIDKRVWACDGTTLDRELFDCLAPVCDSLAAK